MMVIVCLFFLKAPLHSTVLFQLRAIENWLSEFGHPNARTICGLQSGTELKEYLSCVSPA